MKKNSAKTDCFLSTLLIPFFILQANAQAPGFSGSTISGFVFDSERRPVTQIPVELLNDVNSVLQRLKTDGSGRFIFRGVAQGRFQIRVLPLGTNYEEQTQEVELYGVGPSGQPIRDNLQKDFYLRLRNSNSVSPAGSVFVQEIPKEAEAIYQKALADLESRRVEVGVAGLENALKLFPTYYLALEKLGLVYTIQQEYKKAVGVLERAVTVNPRSFDGWYGLSYSNYALERSEAAVAAAQKAVTLNSNSEQALLFLGLSLRQAKRYEAAEKPLKQADKITKGLSSDIHWNLALLYAKNLNRFAEAANELELYLKLKTDLDTIDTDNIKKLIKKYRESLPSK